MSSRVDSRTRVLVLCDFAAGGPDTIRQHAQALGKYTEMEVFLYCPYQRGCPVWLDLDDFDVVVIHYSVYILSDVFLNHEWVARLRRTAALKALFLQDEYRRVEEFHRRILELGIGMIFTMVPPRSWDYMYPEAVLPDLVKVRTLAGYAPDALAAREPDWDADRPIDVGYRARGVGLWWLGRLFQEKRLIGEGFLARAGGTDLAVDISMREEDRIYGAAWQEFLRSCRCTLGSETGASVIDFTGRVERDVKAYCDAHPGATFEEVQAKFFAHLEGIVQWDNLSPRVFEAVGLGCCLVLFEGRYAGILEPDVHYIELKKDFSNYPEVVAKIRDDATVRKIAKRAYRDLIASRRFTYEAFARETADALEAELSRRPPRIVPEPYGKRARLRGALRWVTTPARLASLFFEEYLIPLARKANAALARFLFRERVWVANVHDELFSRVYVPHVSSRKLHPELLAEHRRLRWVATVGTLERFGPPHDERAAPR